MARWAVVWAIVIAGSTASAAPKVAPETKAIAAVIEEQFAGFRDTKRTSVYAKDAMVSMTGGTSTPQVNKLDHADGKWTIFGPATVGKHKVRDLRVTVAKDGKAAWASFVAKVTVDGLAKSGAVDLRATELFVSTGSGWQVRAAAWSLGVTAPAIAKAAKAEKFATLETVFDQNLGEREVIAAIKALGTSAIDATATARTDLVSVGPTPGEVTVGGKKVAAKHKKDWLEKLSVTGSVWGVTAGTTACATANIELERGKVTVPGRVFAVFEKDSSGAWSPVLVHVAVAPPG
jgi:hypothetical protein